jgi:hypothetical protein
MVDGNVLNEDSPQNLHIYRADVYHLVDGKVQIDSLTKSPAIYNMHFIEHCDTGESAKRLVLESMLDSGECIDDYEIKVYEVSKKDMNMAIGLSNLLDMFRDYRRHSEMGGPLCGGSLDDSLA